MSGLQCTRSLKHIPVRVKWLSPRRTIRIPPPFRQQGDSDPRSEGYWEVKYPLRENVDEFSCSRRGRSLNRQHACQLVHRLQDRRSGNSRSDGPAARVDPACTTNHDRSEHEFRPRGRRWRLENIESTNPSSSTGDCARDR